MVARRPTEKSSRVPLDRKFFEEVGPENSTMEDYCWELFEQKH